MHNSHNHTNSSDAQPVHGLYVARPRLLTIVVATTGAVALWWVFSMYTNPDFMVEIDTQLWSCF
jgi:hypothetical protein